MATISITIPDAVMPRVTEALAKQNNYQDTIPDPQNPNVTIPNPETKAQFAQRMIRDYIKSTLASYEGTVANTTAAEKARTDIG